VREKGISQFHVNTFRGDLQLAALGDLDSLDGLVASSGRVLLDLLHDIVALENLAEHDVLAIEPAVGIVC
jgi:hypothetical protein